MGGWIQSDVYITPVCGVSECLRKDIKTFIKVAINNSKINCLFFPFSGRQSIRHYTALKSFIFEWQCWDRECVYPSIEPNGDVLAIILDALINTLTLFIRIIKEGVHNNKSLTTLTEPTIKRHIQFNHKIQIVATTPYRQHVA